MRSAWAIAKKKRGTRRHPATTTRTFPNGHGPLGTATRGGQTGTTTTRQQPTCRTRMTTPNSAARRAIAAQHAPTFFLARRSAIALLKQTQQRKASFLRSFTRILRSRLYPEARELEREVNEENKLLYNNSLTTIREVSLLARSPPISPMKQLLNLIRALLASLKPAPKQPTLESYGQTVNDVPPEQARSVMQWLSASLLNAGYYGRSHLFWDDGNTDWEQVMMTAVMRSEPVFLYRLGERPSSPAPGCYWRLMGEHPSLRIYQLEARE